MNNPNYYPPQAPQKQSNGCAVASLVCGIIAFLCFNPMYLISITAIVLGIVGVSKHDSSKGMATAGIILGAVSIVTSFIMDLIVTIFSFGLGFFTFFI